MIRPMENNLPAGSGRLLSLDVLRGMTVAGMILVNNPGSWGGGIRSFAACGVERTDADRSGLSAVHVHHGRFYLSVAAQVRLCVQRRGHTQDTGPHGGDFRRRSGFCFSMQSLAEQGVPLWERVARSADSFERIRILGVLQRLALSYGA